MRQAGTCAGVFRGRRDAGFAAGQGPGARSVFWKIAHFGAASRHLRLATAAVTGAHGSVPDFGGSVGPDSEAEQSHGKQKIKRQPKDNAAKTRERKSSHGQEFHAETTKNR